MKARIILILTTALIAGSGHAQNQEATDSLTRQLQEVVVTAKQPATRLIGSTLVSTIPGTNLADLGTALDVLAQLPMIKVDDATVSVIGKSNIEIFIDGRPMRDNQELQQLLSSNLKKVELLMAPGAAYASTTGAVLKITTRRNFTEGLSVTDQFQLQRRRKWSAMDYLSFSYRADAWEFFVNGTINHNNSLNRGTTTNTLLFNGEKTVVGSSQNSSTPTTVGVIKGGFNYSKGAQSLGAYYRYNPERGDFNNSGTEWIDDNPAVRREIDKHIRANSHLASLYYENRFAEKYLLHFDGDFRQSNQKNDVATTYPHSNNQDVNANDRRTSTLWAGKLYLNFPLWNGEFTVGTQDSHTRTSLDYRMLNSSVSEYIPSSLTAARQPSVGYSFNDESQISLSYKMATVKPPYSQLTGSLNYTGLHQIEGGNPALHDEHAHDVQLFGMWKGFMLQADYTRALDTYAFVKQLYPAANLQLLMHPVNIDVSALSLYLVWNRAVGRWTPNVTAGVYRQWLTLGDTRYEKPIFSYYFDNMFALPHGWLITANINGSSQGDMHTNRFGATWFTMDASVGKTFLNKALTVKLSATDIFNTANNDWTMNTYGVFVDKRQSYDRRGISLNVIYNFHPRKSTYKGTSASEAEIKRL